MNYNEIKSAWLAGTLCFGEAFQLLSEAGYCANLLNDDAGRWAVRFDGYQTVPDPDIPIDITSTFIVHARDWKPDITAALTHALTVDDEQPPGM